MQSCEFLPTLIFGGEGGTFMIRAHFWGLSHLFCTGLSPFSGVVVNFGEQIFSLEYVGTYEKYIYLVRPHHLLFHKAGRKYDIAMSSCDVIKTL